jgi:hypothetical protein
VLIAVWASLGFFVAVLIGGTIWVAVNGLHAWRRAGRVPGRLLGQISELSAGAAVLEQRAAALGSEGAILQRNVAELSADIERTRTIVAATEDARNAIAFARLFLPTK